MKMQRFLSNKINPIMCSVSQIHPQYEPGKPSNEVNTLLLIYKVSQSDGEKTNQQKAKKPSCFVFILLCCPQVAKCGKL